MLLGVTIVWRDAQPDLPFVLRLPLGSAGTALYPPPSIQSRHMLTPYRPSAATAAAAADAGILGLDPPSALRRSARQRPAYLPPVLLKNLSATTQPLGAETRCFPCPSPFLNLRW